MLGVALIELGNEFTGCFCDYFCGVFQAGNHLWHQQLHLLGGRSLLYHLRLEWDESRHHEHGVLAGALMIDICDSISDEGGEYELQFLWKFDESADYLVRLFTNGTLYTKPWL